jgi:hypothetical protein
VKACKPVSRRDRTSLAARAIVRTRMMLRVKPKPVKRRGAQKTIAAE